MLRNLGYINRLWYMFFYGRCNLCDFQVCLFIYNNHVLVGIEI